MNLYYNAKGLKPFTKKVMHNFTIMNKVIELIKKDFKIDWRQQNPFAGIILYLVSSIFVSYMSLKSVITIETWNGLFWIILLFISLNAIAKSFIQEEGRTLYYYFNCTPSHVLAAKLIYSFVYLVFLALVAFIIYSILLGYPSMDMKLFLLNLILGCLGLSSVFNIVSAISFRTSNKMVMMAVLGFPIIIPILILSINNSTKIMDGYILQQIIGNVITLFSLDVIIIVLGFALFPFAWKA